MNSKHPILVTGAHRSGTTWVGKMLAADVDTAYISEPLNVLHRPGVFRAPVKHWYTYITEENENEYLPAFRELLNFQYHIWLEIKSLRSQGTFCAWGVTFIFSSTAACRDSAPSSKTRSHFSPRPGLLNG
jgi:hypothetical protein